MLSGTPIQRRSTGDNSSTIQTFWSNAIIPDASSIVEPFIFNLPQFTTVGGTQNYYGQDPGAVFTSQNSPFIRFNFSANTESFSGSSQIVHEIYKLKHEDFIAFNPDFQKLDSKLNVDDDVITEEEVIVENGVKTIRSVSKKIRKSATTEQYAKVDLLTFEDIQTFLDTPYITITSGTSGFTSLVYDFFPGQFTKLELSATTAGDGDNTSEPFKRVLFEDKGQYFVDTTFTFDYTAPNGYYDREGLYIDSRDNEISEELTGTTEDVSNEVNEGGLLNYSAQYDQVTRFKTASDVSFISAGTFSGITVRGYFFTYFTVPNKPEFEKPIVSGTMETFSPQIYFSNVDDGDRYMVEVTYGVSNTVFSGSTFKYNIDKDLTDGIQRAEIPLKTASNFRYRVGNVKLIKNIFGVEQQIISFSDSLTGRTQEQPAATFVRSQTDSPFTSVVPELVVPPSIEIENSGSYMLSGTVSGSTVTGATIQLVNEGGYATSAATDLVGNYSFSGLTRGVYTLFIEYRGYKTNSQNIDLNNSIVNNVNIEILWDNEFDTWSSKENDLMGPK